jgi:hypothetical protein
MSDHCIPVNVSSSETNRKGFGKRRCDKTGTRMAKRMLKQPKTRISLQERSR